MAKLKLPAFKKPDFKNRKTVVLSLLFVIVVAAVAWVFFGDNIQNKGKLYAEAAGHKIYEKEAKALVGENKDVNDHDAAEVLADKYFTEALAKEQNISISEEDIAQEYGQEFINLKEANEYAYQSSVNRLYLKKLAVSHAGIYKGQYIVTHFSRHVPYKSDLLAEERLADPDLGNKAVIAKDKKYAGNLINRLYNEINSGKISFDEAINIEKKDPVVGERVYPSLTHSGSFDTSKIPFTLVDISSIKNNGEDLKPGELIQPFVVRVSNSVNSDSTAESYWVMVRLDSVAGGGAEVGFNRYLDEARKRLGYGIYV